MENIETPKPETPKPAARKPRGKKSTSKPAAKPEKPAALTSGDAATEYSSSIRKQIDAAYPGILDAVEKSGYVNGSKLYNLFIGKILFVQNFPTPKTIAALPAAKPSGLKIVNTPPASLKSVAAIFPENHPVKIIITITTRGKLYRTIHVNSLY